jgi:hypothetical protein
MPNYKDLNNAIYFLESTDQEYLLPAGCELIPDTQATEILAAIPEPIPTISMRQARLALLNANLLSSVDAAITADDVRIWWDYSTTVERSSLLVDAVLTGLGLTSNQIDDLFLAAAQL